MLTKRKSQGNPWLIITYEKFKIVDLEIQEEWNYFVCGKLGHHISAFDTGRGKMTYQAVFKFDMVYNFGIVAKYRC